MTIEQISRRGHMAGGPRHAVDSIEISMVIILMMMTVVATTMAVVVRMRRALLL